MGIHGNDGIMLEVLVCMCGSITFLFLRYIDSFLFENGEEVNLECS